MFVRLWHLYVFTVTGSNNIAGYTTDLSIRYTSMNDSSGSEPKIPRVNLNSRFQVAVIRKREQIGKIRHGADVDIKKNAWEYTENKVSHITIFLQAAYASIRTTHIITDYVS